MGILPKYRVKDCYKNQDVQDPRQPDDNLCWAVQWDGGGGQVWHWLRPQFSVVRLRPRPRLRWPVIASRVTEPEPASSPGAGVSSHMCSPGHTQPRTHLTNIVTRRSGSSNIQTCPLLSHQNMCWRPKLWRIEKFTWWPEDDSAHNDVTDDEYSADSSPLTSSELLHYVYKKFEVNNMNASFIHCSICSSFKS